MIKEKIVDVLKAEYIDRSIQIRHDATLRWSVTSGLLIAEGYIFQIASNVSTTQYNKTWLFILALLVSIGIIIWNLVFEYRIAHGVFAKMEIARRLNLLLEKSVLFHGIEASDRFSKPRNWQSKMALLLFSIVCGLLMVIPFYIFRDFILTCSIFQSIQYIKIPFNLLINTCLILFGIIIGLLIITIFNKLEKSILDRFASISKEFSLETQENKSGK